MAKYFALRLIPRRPTFMQDMTDAERSIMKQHVAYWTNLMTAGKIIVFGPVLDPKGGYGLGVVKVDDEEELQGLMNNDPAVSINTYEWQPMMAITNENKPG
jgi:uncharacterized protein YciI